MKQAIKKAVCIICVILLCGCSATGFTSFSIEELLRAPQPSPEQNAVQKALNSHLGETLQLKYPRFGNETTPFIMRDFDGDGQNEAAVLYTSAAKGQNVHLAILESKNGVWEVVQEIEGLAGEVMLVDSIALYANAPDCIVISYSAQSMNDKYLGVYTYQEETLTPVFTQAYSNYTICDIDKDALQELVYVQTEKPSLYIVKVMENELKVANNLPLDERFSSCINITASESGTIAVDGALQAAGIATAVYSLQGGSLSRLVHEKADVFNLSKRYVPTLLSTDIDDNGSVDVPCVVKSIDTFNNTRRFYFITWNDFTLASHEKRYGVYDAQYNYFVRLPSDWNGEFNITDDGTDDGGWQLRSKDGYKTILSTKIVPRSYDAGLYTQAANLGEKRLLLSFGDSCTSFQINMITSGIRVF